MPYEWPHRNLDVAGDFFVDCDDLLERYDVMIERFCDRKSRRLKCFADLRGAYECILKCAIAYAAPRNELRREIIRGVERHSHNISALEGAVSSEVQSLLSLKAYGGVLDLLPVGLRYALDGYDFIKANHETYYRTVGCDSWMDELRAYVGCIRDAMDGVLENHSCIVSGADITLQALLEVEYNKFRKK